MSVAVCLPLQAVAWESFYLPAVVIADSLWSGNIELITVCAALVWPAVSVSANVFCRVVRPRAWWGVGLLWGAPLVTLAPLGAIVAGSVFLPRLLLWSAAWTGCALLLARIRREQKSTSEGPGRE